jgi:uracil-DNA glycosylase family 4
MNNTIEKIKQQVINCKKCKLSETRTNAVPGKGNFKSDVILIGEAPGRNEDKNGEPFVGAAGKRLEEALKKTGIERKDVYITNVVKCRPPSNRVPIDEERKACQDYIKNEIKIIQPKIICILGNTAFNSMLGGGEITKFRGKTVRKNNQIYFLTIHPAATIYNQKLIQVLDEDIERLFSLVDNLKKSLEVSIDIEISS